MFYAIWLAKWKVLSMVGAFLFVIFMTHEMSHSGSNHSNTTQQQCR